MQRHPIRALQRSPRHPIRLLAALACILVSTSPAWGLTLPVNALWYNGDPISGGLANFFRPPDDLRFVYDDFTVPISSSWIVETVWSNNGILNETPQVTHAVWEIRSGVSAGNGGTLIAGGTNSATQTATGGSENIRTDFTITVTGLNVHLSPGNYWLTIAPIVPSEPIGISVVKPTAGAGAVGVPAGNNKNAFIDGPSVGVDFAPTPPFCFSCSDFSMGVAGREVDRKVRAPRTGILVAAGLSVIAAHLARRRHPVHRG